MPEDSLSRFFAPQPWSCESLTAMSLRVELAGGVFILAPVSLSLRVSAPRSGRKLLFLCFIDFHTSDAYGGPRLDVACEFRSKWLDGLYQK